MTDFEDRLSTALRSVGDDAPDAHGLAPAARRRAGVRRRRTALTSVAAVVAVAGVAGGVAVLGDRDSRTPQVTDTPTATASPSGRIESWRDISVTVPADWGHGSLDDWCASDGQLGEPVVERAGGASVDILCDPQLGYGVQFSDGAVFDAAVPPGEVWQYTDADGRMYPKGAWLGYQRTADAMVLTVLPTQEGAAAVLGSFEQVGGLDPHGCPDRLPHAMSSPGDDVLRLCRYAADGWLDQSEILAGSDAREAVDALDAAPVREPKRCPESANQAAIQVWSGDLSGSVRLEGCPGVFGWGGEERDLTSDVLYWVLSPGWTGGVEGDVPMPEKLRE